MADESSPFLVLMQRVRAGSDEAARELLERCGGHILRVIRRTMHRKLRPKYDSDDFAQAVWASFFAGPPGRYQFEHPQALIAFLATLAQRKVLEAVRQRLYLQKYNIDREQPLDDGSAGPAVAARQPTPSQVAVAEDEWRRLIRDLPLQYRRILDLLRQGHSQREVAEQLGICEKTVRRLLDKIRAEPVP